MPLAWADERSPMLTSSRIKEQEQPMHHPWCLHSELTGGQAGVRCSGTYFAPQRQEHQEVLQIKPASGQPPASATVHARGTGASSEEAGTPVDSEGLWTQIREAFVALKEMLKPGPANSGLEPKSSTSNGNFAWSVICRS